MDKTRLCEISGIFSQRKRKAIGTYKQLLSIAAGREWQRITKEETRSFDDDCGFHRLLADIARSAFLTKYQQGKLYFGLYYSDPITFKKKTTLQYIIAVI